MFNQLMRTILSATAITAGGAGAALAAEPLPPSINTPKLIAAAGGNPQLTSTAAYIGALCPNLTPGTDLRLRCAAALGASASAPPLATAALGQITPEQILAQSAVVDGSVTSASAAVAGRLSALGGLGFRTAMNRYQPIQLATAGDTAGLGGASSAKLQGFVNVVFGSGDKNTDPLATGYSFDQHSITGGVDYRFSDRLTAGVSLSYGDTNLDFDARGGKLKTKATVGTVYGLWTLNDRLQLSGLVSYGRVDYTSDRNINYAESATSTISRVAHGSTKGDQWEGTVTLSYAMPASNGWTYGPSLAVSARSLDLDAFAESGADGLNLTYADQSTDSLQVIVGFDVSKAISTNSGVFSPYGRAQAIYEAKDDKRTVAIRYTADTTGFFPGIRLTTSSPDRMRFLLGGGVAAQFAGGWSGFADAETIVGLEDVSGYNVTLGLRKEF